MRTAATGLAMVFALAGFARSQETPLAGPSLIVVDPGHGGEDIGARGASGLTEKQLTLEVAQTLRTRLQAAGRLRVVLTREDDQPVTADQRAALANAASGRLFLSLHANTAPTPGVSGAEVYYQSIPPTAPGDAGPADSFLIPWERAHVPHYDLSARAAGIVRDALQESVPMSAQPARPASLRPLVGLTMPAILVEMLYLSSPEQEAAVADLKDLITQALATGVERFLADAPAPAR